MFSLTKVPILLCDLTRMFRCLINVSANGFLLLIKPCIKRHRTHSKIEDAFQSFKKPCKMKNKILFGIKIVQKNVI